MSSLSPNQAYATMTQTVIPRPVAWVLTANETGSYNLAPYSYFNAISSNPPMVFISCALKPDGSIKDTRNNLEKREYCVIHIAHQQMASAMTASSATLPRNRSEVIELDLQLSAMPGSDLPRLTDCRIAYAAVLRETKMIEQQWLGFLELLHLYVDDHVIGLDGKGRLKVHAEQVDPLGRLGGGEYLSAGEIINIPRPA